MKHIEQANESYLKCDKEGCDYRTNVPFENFPQWIGAPCPKCGTNLLTDEDYQRAKLVMDSMDFVNSLTAEDIEKISEFAKEHLPEELKKQLDQFSPDELVSMHIETHKDISIDVKKINSEPNTEVCDATKE